VITTPAGIVPVPVATSLPAFSGDPEQGQTLTESHGTWSFNPDAYSYQWVRCSGTACSAIPGATSQTFTLNGDDAGQTIAVQETAANSGGSGGAVTSAHSSVVKATSTTGLVVFPSSPVTDEGVTLIATITSGAGAAAPSGTLIFTNGAAPISSCSNDPVNPTGQTVTVTCETEFSATTARLAAVYRPATGSIVSGSTSPTRIVTVAKSPTSTDPPSGRGSSQP
jgi:hypothetical protein